MKNKWILLAMIIPAFVAVAANAPIQRIDIVNLLGSGGSTPSSVVISLDNGAAAQCFTKTIAYQEAITVWVGIGQSCVLPVGGINITPVPGASGVVYDTPIAPQYFNDTLYSAQITISQNVAPVFDSGNGSLLIPGTLQVNVVSHWKGVHESLP